MHTPDVTTPLSFDLYMEPFIRGFGMLRLCQQNYYVYMHQPAMPPSAPGPVPLDAIHAGARRWREEIIPEVRGIDQHYLTTDFDSMSAEELAAELDRLADVRVRCGQLHTMATLPWWMGMMSLIETVRELTGGDDLAALRLVQGYGNKSVEAGERLWQLSRLAESIPEARDKLLALADAPADKQLAAVDVASILEDHNYYIDQRVGVLPRRLVLDAGRRLTSAGTLDDATDVFYLRRDELRSALLGSSEGLAALAEDRRKEMVRWAQVRPPQTVGAPPVATATEDEDPDRFWGTHKLRSDRPGELKGNGASAGVGRGPARVLATLNEAGRFQPGDVLVTRTTMPPWTPLFAVASAVVTETGGILSHAAVTAREYGLPAVLCVENATGLIRDGQPVEVDGSNGTVRILS